jgi:hypothetical protein
LADAMAVSSTSRAQSALGRSDLVRGGSPARGASFNDMAHSN